MSVVAVERSLAGLGRAHGWSPAEPLVPAREVRGEGAPIILGEAEIRNAARASCGDLTEIDVGAEVMRQLVQAPIAAVIRSIIFRTKLGENSCLFCDASRFLSISARRITWHSMTPLVATDTTDRICHRCRPLCGHRR
jgi:hypothetical protein